MKGELFLCVLFCFGVFFDFLEEEENISTKETIPGFVEWVTLG